MKKGIFAIESIKYQGTEFLDSIAECIDELRSATYSKLKDKELYLSKPIKDIEKLINKHTNLSVTINRCNWGAGAYIPRINKNNVLLDTDYRLTLDILNISLEEDLIKASEKVSKSEIKGKVDLNSGKVSGIFSKLELRIAISKDLLLNSKKYSSLEVSSAIIHEVGHLFTHIEYSSRMISTNQILALVTKTVDNKISRASKEIIYTNIENKLPLIKDQLDTLLKSEDVSVSSIIVLNGIVEQTKSELGGINVYDSVSSEQLADQFANMHGCGKHLITALEKVTNDKFLTIPIFTTILAIPVILSAPVLALSTFSAYVVLLISTMDGKNVYDNIYSRYTRIKHSNIQIIKDKDTDDNERKYLLEQNEYIDTVLEKYNDNKSIIQYLAYWTKPGYRKAKDYEDLQKGLEKLANNDLFGQATKLKHLNKEINNVKH